MKVFRLIKNNQNREGFTIVELMIATAVFAVILALSLTGFLQIGQLFYKGVNITNTTNTAKQVISSLKSDISFDSDTAAITRFDSPAISTPIGSVTRSWFCAGSNRYSFILYKQVDREAAASEMKTDDPFGWYRFGLLKDQIPITLSCPNPFTSPVGAGKIDPTNTTELIGDKMRLSHFNIFPVVNKLYTISVKIAYGDDDVLDNFDNLNAKCKSGASSRYCFVTELRTSARTGFQ